MKMRVLFLLSVAACFSCSQTFIEIQSKGVTLQDKTVIHYLEAGQGPALVLVHGLGGSSEVWRNAIRHLAKRYRVIALDLPGYGKSDKPRSEYSVDYYAGVLANFIEVLGIEKAALAGNALGGWITALTVLNHPEKVSHLVLVNSEGFRTDRPSPINPNPKNKEEQRALMAALFFNKSFITDKAISDEWEYRKDIRTTVQATLASIKIKNSYLNDRLKNIKVPTLIVWGRQDLLVPVSVAEKIASEIPGSKLVFIENAGNLPQVEQPVAFYRVMKRFVRSW